MSGRFLGITLQSYKVAECGIVFIYTSQVDVDDGPGLRLTRETSKRVGSLITGSLCMLLYHVSLPFLVHTSQVLLMLFLDAMYFIPKPTLYRPTSQLSSTQSADKPLEVIWKQGLSTSYRLNYSEWLITNGGLAGSPAAPANSEFCI